MAENDGQEKTEQASDKRLKDGRDKGQVAKSMEINSLALLTAGAAGILMTKSYMGNKISDFSINIFSKLDSTSINRQSMIDFLRGVIVDFMMIVLPLLIILAVISAVSNIAQVGLKFSFKAAAPKMEKFKVMSNMKRMLFSSRSLVEVLKTLLKLSIISYITYTILFDLVIKSTYLPASPIEYIGQFLSDSSYHLVWKLILTFTLIAGVDFGYQKYKHTKDMMMTKQEVKEENKESEGSPETKSRIRKIQYSLARTRMMAEVPKADVVITNPTHYAIALKYNMQKDTAPKVLAKGVDETAQKIKAIAVKNNIPLHEDRELARALYKLCDPGDFIPEDLFKAVAKILAFVFNLKNEKKKRIV